MKNQGHRIPFTPWTCPPHNECIHRPVINIRSIFLGSDECNRTYSYMHVVEPLIDILEVSVIGYIFT